MAYKRKRISKRRPARKVRRTRKTAPVRRMVKMEVKRQIETKSDQSTLATKVLWTVGSVNFPDNVIVVGPNSSTLQIGQGAGQGGRVGNRIMTQSLKFRAMLTTTDYDVTTNPVPRPTLVRMVVLYDREDPNAVPVPGSNFFQDGSTSTGFTGGIPDVLRPINTDRYRVMMSKDYKMGNAAYTGTTGSVATQGSYQAWTNNDFKLNTRVYLDLTKFYPKRVIFNDALTEPTTRGLYIFFYYVAADGTALPVENQLIQINYMQDFKYKDA